MQTHNPPNAEVLYRQDTRRASATGARVLMGLAAVGALAAVATSIQVVRDAGLETLVVEIWRFAGFALFSDLFALLAYRPLHYAGVWELVIVNKLALTIAALTYASDAEGAGGVALVDGILTGVLLAACLLSRGWRAWSYVAPRCPRAIRRSDASAPSPPPEPPRRDGRVLACDGMRRHFPIEREDSEARTKTDRAGSVLMSGSAEASFQARRLLASSHKAPYTHYPP